MHSPRLVSIATALAAGLNGAASRTLFAQAPAAAPSAAATYMERYREIANLAPDVDHVAEVHHLVLQRDAGRLILESGKLALLTPVGGRTVGAVFEGRGRFVLTPPLPTERIEMKRFAGDSTLDDSLHEAILLFTDSTLDQLRALNFGPGAVPGGAGGHVEDLVGSLKGEHQGSFDASVIGPLLNGESNGLFLARVARDNGADVLFEVDPSSSQAVTLYQPVSRRRWGTNWAVVTEFAGAGQPASVWAAWEFRDRLHVPAYKLDVRLTEGATGNLDLAGAATLTVVAQEPVGPWLVFKLDGKLDVDSARRGDGAAAPAFKADQTSDLWVSGGRRLGAGDTLTLTVYYHGDMFYHLVNLFFIDPGTWWFPANAEGPQLATFDITYHAPMQYPLVSVGELADTSAEGQHVRVTHWIQRQPVQDATFNLGTFELYHQHNVGAASLDVLTSEAAHLAIRQLTKGQAPEQSHKSEAVATDISNSLAFFTTMFGEPTYDHYYVTEIPYAEGVSFPGMIDLSLETFQTTALDGADESFRAHEVAHQWWGNGVLGGSDRDRWLSEGLAEFSALWYLQAERRSSQPYFRFLDHYRADIEADQNDVGAIWLGHRNSTPDWPNGYPIMTYEKGAWVFNMLRVLMLDLRTMSDDRFKATMQDYYQSFLGRTATTGDLQEVVERHMGMPMDWFFDEWVKGTGLPTYHVAWKNEPADGGRFRIRLRVRQEHVPATFRMPVLVSADLGQDRIAHFRVDVRDSAGEYVSPPLPAEAKNVTFNDLHAVLAEVKTESW